MPYLIWLFLNMFPFLIFGFYFQAIIFRIFFSTNNICQTFKFNFKFKINQYEEHYNPNNVSMRQQQQNDKTISTNQNNEVVFIPDQTSVRKRTC